MLKTFPGMTVEVTSLAKGKSQTLFDGIFAAGGITLSQVTIMTGLEPYLIQNWVKRGFVTAPVNRTYSREQLARIAIINMLREVLQLDRICGLVKIISGTPNDPSDDLISNEELYHRYVDMLADLDAELPDQRTVAAAAERAAADFEEKTPGARKKLVTILSVMLFAHTASRYQGTAVELLAKLE